MKKNLISIVILTFVLACNQNHSPKPRGFFRIDFPEKQYHKINSDFPYQFEIPDYANVTADSRNPGKEDWININIPENKAEVHISYYQLQNAPKPSRQLLAEFIEESRELAYKHSVKANAIEEQIFMNPGREVYGTIYRIKGNAASPVQFFLTDSTTHFLRGALYIRATPNIDSLKPVVNFLEEDVVRLIETTYWE
jgi:gliding motility-associated lipoprotein GldD